MPVNTPIKANSPESVSGIREHRYDDPQTPKIRTSKMERRPAETTSCSHLHLIRNILEKEGFKADAHISYNDERLLNAPQAERPCPVLLQTSNI